MDLAESEERLWKRVDKSGDCWIWTGARKGTRRSYGNLTINEKQYSAHRIAYELTFGVIPEGMQVLHHCDNGLCINPSHLFLGTVKDNVSDMIRKGRAQWQPDTSAMIHPPHAPKITQEQVQQIRHLYCTRIITQTELGKQFGISQKYVSQIVRGRDVRTRSSG